MKVLIVKANATNGELDDTYYAVIPADRMTIEVIFKRAELFRQAYKKDSELYQLEYWAHETVFVSYATLDAAGVDLEAVDRGTTLSTLRKTIFEELEARQERVEVPTMRIQEDCVLWECILKHTDVTIETNDLSYNMLEALR